MALNDGDATQTVRGKALTGHGVENRKSVESKDNNRTDVTTSESIQDVRGVQSVTKVEGRQGNFSDQKPSTSAKPRYKFKGCADRSRAPLKKRPTTPLPHVSVPPSLRPASSQNRVVLPPTFLRQTSSTYGDFNHHEMIPPQLGFTASRGQALISEPLLETPQPPTFPWVPPSAAAGFSIPPVLSAFTPSVLEQHTPLLNAGHRRIDASERPRENEATPRPYGYTAYNETGPVPMPSPMTPGSRMNFPYGALPASYAAHRGPMHMPDYRSANLFEMGSNPRTDPFWAYSARERRLFEDVPLTNRPCKCGHSRCLKLYCECFHLGFFCDEQLCRCKNCLNNEASNDPRGERVLAIRKILAKRPDAFLVKKTKKSGQGCGCKKSE